MMKLSAITLALAWIGTSPVAQAAILTVVGDTTSKPVFTRPIEDLSTLSAIGVGVHYDVFSFNVGVSGQYTFLTTGAFDTFTVLYAGSFNPASALSNALIANDDLLDGFTTSGFAAALLAGTTYRYVTTGFDATEFGAYSTTIGGPGVVSAIPEPALWALFGAGLGGFGLLRWRSAPHRRLSPPLA